VDAVVHAQHLYYSDQDVTGAASIKRCAHSGCPTPETIAPNENNSFFMTQDAVSVYWLTRDAFNGPVTIRRWAK
jgi:hypothetical protein